MKISELAKKIKMPSKQLLVQVVKLGVSAKSAQSSLSAQDLEKVLKMITNKKPSVDVQEIKRGEDSKKKPATKAAAAKKAPSAKEAPDKKALSKKEVSKKKDRPQDKAL